MQHILVVDDEVIVRDVVCRYLERDGFRVTQARTGDEAQAVLAAGPVDLIVLDVMMPGANGFDICRSVRATSDTPIILLTARGDEADRIVGLELGADDYVTKPFSPRELTARVRTVLRRGAPVRQTERLVHGSLVIDATTRDVTLDGAVLHLTAKEFDLLHFMAQHPRQVFSRDHLMERVWGYQVAYDSGTVTVHIRRLREKIEQNPSSPTRLETVWGVGYRFVP